MDAIRKEQLWVIARKRAGFKRHLISYIVFNIFFWVIWYFISRSKTDTDVEIGGLPWPAYCTIFWGIGVVMNYLGVYVFNKNNLTEREYLKLVKEEEKKNPESKNE